MKSVSIQKKLTLIVSVLFFTAYFFSLYFTHKIFFNFIKQQNKNHVITLASYLTSALTAPILEGDREKINEISRTFAGDKDFEFILALDAEKNLLGKSDFSGKISESVVPEIHKKIKDTDIRSPHHLLKSFEAESFIFPLKQEGTDRPAGFVVIGIKNVLLSRSLEKARYTSIVIGFLLLFIFLFVLNKVNKKFLRPVKGLMAGTEQVSQGNFDCQIEITDDGEFGQLARKFNEMTLILKRLDKQKTILNRKLHQYNEKLEEKIENRTRQLKEIQEDVLLVFNQMPVGILVLNLKGFIQWCNNRLMQIIGITRDRSLTNFHFKDVDQIKTIGFSAILSSLYRHPKKRVLRKQLILPDGAVRDIEITSQPLKRAGGKVDGTIFIIRDLKSEVYSGEKMKKPLRWSNERVNET